MSKVTLPTTRLHSVYWLKFKKAINLFHGLEQFIEPLNAKTVDFIFGIEFGVTFIKQTNSA